ncbi:RDD family protein [Xylophilus sp. GOD-11R]|uniref:RDD family protein n=1 Tax=Xylophilus sp. GOD-11R TaxID=3089814 RepID=UPI00298D4358|nr:RDD family protein [Xylophilus sp. GOD-11R]WPB58773.1 RDD family protein [Xylophilus sp. GOD-11R]
MTPDLHPDGRVGLSDATQESLPKLAPSIARRLAAWLYEGVLLFGVVFIAGYLFGALSQTRNALDNRHALMAFLFVVLGIYFVWFWTRGQTLAMKTWHIRLVDRDGRAVTQMRALCRYLLAWLWFLPPLGASVLLHASLPQTLVALVGWMTCWALASRLHPTRQFVHDALAGTRLITYRAPPRRPGR